MSTLAELVTHRAEAGARYAAAITELRGAFGDLVAIERILEANTGTLASFGGPRPDPIPLRHPVYAPDVSGSFEDDARAAHAVRLAVLGIPDPL